MGGCHNSEQKFSFPNFSSFLSKVEFRPHKYLILWIFGFGNNGMVQDVRTLLENIIRIWIQPYYIKCKYVINCWPNDKFVHKE